MSYLVQQHSLLSVRECTVSKSHASVLVHEASKMLGVKGHVVSRHAQRIIIHFMMANCGKSKTKDNVEAEAVRSMRECPANDLALAGVHAIIDQVGGGTTTGEQQASGDDDDDDAPGGGQRRSKQMQEALQTTAALWKRDQTPWDVAISRFVHGSCKLSHPSTRMSTGFRRSLY